MSNHTPGPWKSDERIVGWQGGDLPSVRVSYMSNEYTSSPIALCEARYLGEREAISNARLIAAAPEMLEALQIVKAAFDKSSLSPYAYQTVVEAIAKATQP